ncbi:MAG: hypothetical protein ACLFPQ_04695 [Candidatus Woesearchaeota archaeon]
MAINPEPNSDKKNKNKQSLKLKSRIFKTELPMLSSVLVFIVLILVFVLFVNSALNYYFANRFLEDANPEYCRMVAEESKGSCYIYVAVERKDISFCSNKYILNDTIQKSCFMNVAAEANMPGECTRFENKDDKDRCFLLVAKETRQYGICENVEDSYLKQKCLLGLE